MFNSITQILAPLTSIEFFFFLQWKSMVPNNCFFIVISSFVFSRRKKLKQVYNLKVNKL